MLSFLTKQVLDETFCTCTSADAVTNLFVMQHDKTSDDDRIYYLQKPPPHTVLDCFLLGAVQLDIFR
jgi:hypothetical protein